MSNTSVENPAPNSAPPLPMWPDDAPGVAVDARLGQKYASVDVDPEKIKALLLEQGGDPNAIPDITITLSKGNFFKSGKATTDGATHEARVSVGRDFAESLAHEGTHLADMTRGKVESQQTYKRRTRIAGLVGFLATGLGGLVATKHGLEIPPVNVATGLISGTAGGILMGYRFGPDERRAFAAGRNKDLKNRYKDAVTLKKR